MLKVDKKDNEAVFFVCLIKSQKILSRFIWMMFLDIYL